MRGYWRGEYRVRCGDVDDEQFLTIVTIAYFENQPSPSRLLVYRRLTVPASGG